MNTQSWEFLVVSGDKLKVMGESYARVCEPIAAKMEPDKGKAYLMRQADTGAPVV